MRRVSTAMITPQMTLAQPIYHNDRLLLKKGCKNINRYVKQLESLGIRQIYIEDAESEGIEIPDAVSMDTRNNCKKALRNTINTYTKNGILELHMISKSVESMLDEILANPEVLVCLNDISSTDDETFVHSVSTTVYSLLIGTQLGYNRALLKKLAMGTLLHDLGKTIVDEKIMFKNGRLSRSEYDYIKQHTTLGYEALKKCSSLSELSRMIALTHHERLDGSGYPNGLKGNDLHEFSRIAAVADTYDALTMDRCYRPKWTAVAASEYLIKKSAVELDPKLSGLLLQQVAIYPNGTMVKLSNGCSGLVKEQNQGVPLRPIIRILTDENDRMVSPYEINLFDKLYITIIESEIEIM